MENISLCLLVCAESDGQAIPIARITNPDLILKAIAGFSEACRAGEGQKIPGAQCKALPVEEPAFPGPKLN